MSAFDPTDTRPTYRVNQAAQSTPSNPFAGLANALIQLLEKIVGSREPDRPQR